jgi:predicted SnoaL-like aldol condensation-catalyzing enzyme
MNATRQVDTPESVVRGFLENVRSGNHPDDSHRYLADVVLAHQLTGEQETTVRRTPPDYADHVRHMIADHGRFTLDVVTIVAAGDLVAVTWRQNGEHHPRVPAAVPVIELAACTYRVTDGRIVEYWLLVDRLGIEHQLQRPHQEATA